MIIFRAASLATLLSYLSSVLAGPGANVNVCINLQTKNAKNFTVTFDPNNGQNKCMLSIGNKATTEVTDSGLSCSYVGYVEGKVSSSGGDLCATDESFWNIAYWTEGLTNNKSGNIKSRWRKQWGSQTNEISFYNHVAASVVCGSKALCNSQLYTWDTGTQPPVYFIFQPDKQDSSLEDEISGASTQIVIEAEDL